VNHLADGAAAEGGFGLSSHRSRSAPTSQRPALKEPTHLPSSLRSSTGIINDISLDDWATAVTALEAELKTVKWYSREYWEVIKWHTDARAVLEAARAAAYRRHE